MTVAALVITTNIVLIHPAMAATRCLSVTWLSLPWPELRANSKAIHR